MKRTTASLLTGALAAGTFAALATLTPSIASATACGPQKVEALGAGSGFVVTTRDGDVQGLLGSAELRDQPDNLWLSAAQGNGKVTVTYPISVEGVPLASQTAQSNYGYEFQRNDALPVGSAGGGDVTYEMVLDFNGPAVAGGFTTLVFEPYYQSQAGKQNTWWSTRDLPGLPDKTGHGSPNWGTLDEISLAQPDAVIQSFGVNLNGTSASAFQASVDSVTFGCNTFVFDLANRAPSAVVAVDDAGDADYRTFVLSGRGSSDPDDGDALSYAWTVTDKATGAVVSTSAASQYEVSVPNGPGTYTAGLTVTDRDGLSSTAAADFTATPPSNTVNTDTKLPNTGASVIGLAALTGAAVVAGGAGTVITRRRRSDSAV
ncbi:LPXTG-motif cell wall anchor domain-containing protein [Blastococcus aggregatus]|uniref:LPXTG-motif cell wall anchor domain-containing protein n=1 Tax=Blastococcus aggregatus TaxID=38502 RepID=A0A285V9G6_9ACTN|nr:PKD domain-containing protein [Blastococcus aggregatus]SOC50752.1 LPXTG-motif cell wall anchor domain-containing protein [Blastococcus aggregatus]